jgi:hypothetical protein
MPTVKGIAIYPDKRVEAVELNGLKDYQRIVLGLIEAVNLKGGTTMYVNEEYWYQFTISDFNSIATDVAGLGGRVDLVLAGILGPVVIVGPVDDEGYDTSITEQAQHWVECVSREAGGVMTTN